MPLKDPEARRKYQREWRKNRYNSSAEFRQRERERIKRGRNRSRDRVNQAIAEFRKEGCSQCEEKDPRCLAAHHLDPAQKEFGMGDARRNAISVKKLQNELSKCICLCFNCHAKEHN